MCSGLFEMFAALNWESDASICKDIQPSASTKAK